VISEADAANTDKIAHLKTILTDAEPIRAELYRDLRVLRCNAGVANR